jgi:magnesium-transporting ATPase (P-type)
MWFLHINDSPGLSGVIGFFSYFVLLSFLIPMSLMVTIEIVKVAQAKLMEWDEQLVVREINEEPRGMSVKNSNLNDELALVRKFLFLNIFII